MPTGVEFANLSMGGHNIERDYSKVQLGIRIRYFEDAATSNQWGYELEWKGKTSVSRIAYELQNKKHIWTPEFIRTCIQSYVVGKLQYGSALYWLRADNKSTSEARFDYANAMAAACGLSAPEALGLLKCRKGTHIKANDRTYLKLCKFLNLPTLKDMAIRQAKRMIDQWSTYEPDLFTFSGDETTGTNAPAGSLLDDLWSLSNEEMNDWYPEYTTAKAKAELGNLDSSLFPEWSIVWAECSKQTRVAYRTICDVTAKSRDIMNTYWLENRRRFRVLEMLDRTKKRLDLIKEPTKRPLWDAASSNKRRKNSEADAHGTNSPYTSVSEPTVVLSQAHKRRTPQTQLPGQKRQRAEFNCLVGHPRRPGRPRKITCRICGYACKQGPTILCLDCCGRHAHIQCWQRQNARHGSLKCGEIKSFLKKDRETADYECTDSNRVADDPLAGVKCDICQANIEPLESDSPETLFKKKNHYLWECTEVPGRVIGDTSSRNEIIYRVASLGLIKRVGSKDTIRRSRRASTISKCSTTTHKFSPTERVHDLDSRHQPGMTTD